MASTMGFNTFQEFCQWCFSRTRPINTAGSKRKSEHPL